MSKVTTAIYPLTADNYATWTIKAKAMLRKEKLWVYTQNEHAVTEDNPADMLTSDEWKKKQEDAANTLLLAIDPLIFRNLQSEKRPQMDTICGTS